MPLRIVILFSLLILVQVALRAQYDPLGSASVDGNDCYTLTPDISGQVGAIWSVNTIDLSQNFSFSTRLYFGDKDGNGADGIYFVFAPSPTIGIGGGSLGFEGISTSFGVEMDTYTNANFGDPSDDHIAIQINGDIMHTTANNLDGPHTLANIEDDEWHCFNFEWDATSQMISYALNDNEFTYGPYDIVNSALAGNPIAHIGFLSGTGQLSNLHQVCFSAPEIDPMEDVTICEGESTILTPDDSGESYLWQIDPSLDDINAQNPTATPSATTTYYVTIERECDYFVQDTVTVTVLPAPQITIESNSPLCEGDTLYLMSSGGASYQWNGPGGYTSTDQNPIITSINATEAGTYSVTVTDADGCPNTAMTEVIVNPLPEIMITAPTPLCANMDPVLFMATPPGGTWTGNISSTGEVDPMALGAGTWAVTYAYTDANSCENSEDFSFEVYPLPPVEIITEGPYCASDAIQQLIAAPSGGQWGGAVTVNGDFDVSNLGIGVHEVWYSYTDINGCTNGDTTLIQIVDNAEVSIDSVVGPYCLDAGIQTLTASPGGGSWTGQIEPDGSFDPRDLGPGLHQFIYSSNSMNCGGSDTIEIEVFDIPTANISGGGTYCAGIDTVFNIAIDVEGQSPFTLVYTIDEMNPTWLTIMNDTNLAVSDAGQYSLISIVDGSGCSGLVSGMADISVLDAPMVSDVVIMCDSTESFFTVSFDITGGDTLTYNIGSGASGTLTAGNPYRFESDNIPTGSNYLFVVDDANSCMPTEISGQHQCACITTAGTMPTDTIHLCSDDQATTTGNGDHELDGNDTLIYVLHDGNSDMLGTIYAINDSAVFSFIPGLTLGQVYYISAVAGNQSDTAAINFNDACLAVSVGTPVVWHAIPAGNITVDDDIICQGDSAIIRFNFTGEAPFQFRYILNNDTSAATSTENFHEINLIGNTSNINITFLDISDNTPAACTALINQSIEVVVNLAARTDAVARICHGDSILLGGMMQTIAGVYFDTLSTTNSCDSIVVTALEVLDPDTTQLFDVTCDSSLLGNQIMQLNNMQGCDSIVITTFTFSLSDTVINYGSTCDQSMAGTTIRSLIGNDGCDSIVIDIIELLPTDTTRLEAVTCDSTAVGISQQIESNQFGCDSVIITTYLLAPQMALNVTITHPHCLDSMAGAIAIAVEGGTGPYTYSLDAMTAQDQGIFTNLTSGNYRINVMDANGCQIQEEVTLNSPEQFSVNLGENQFIDIGNSTELQATITINIDDVDSIHWTSVDTGCARCLSIAVSPLETTTYGIVVTDENGCMANDDITIFVETNRNVFFPSAFSPNNDGVNDRFFPRSKENVINNIRTLKIFNRWGGEVFEAFNLRPNRASDGWDGTANNEPLNPAVFVYYAEIEFTDGTVMQFDGNIKLLR